MSKDKTLLSLADLGRLCKDGEIAVIVSDEESDPTTSQKDEGNEGVAQNIITPLGIPLGEAIATERALDLEHEAATQPASAPVGESDETEQLEIDIDQFAGIICDLDEATKKALIAKVREREGVAPVAVEPAEASSEKAPVPEKVPAPKKEVVTFRLGQFVRMDLAAKLAAAPEKEHLLELRGKGSVVRCSVSLVDEDGYRHVLLKVVRVTGEFTKKFRDGFRFYQAEVFGVVGIRDTKRTKSTEALRKVIAEIECGIRERHEERDKQHRDRRPHHGHERREVKAQAK